MGPPAAAALAAEVAADDAELVAALVLAFEAAEDVALLDALRLLTVDALLLAGALGASAAPPQAAASSDSAPSAAATRVPFSQLTPLGFSCLTLLL